MRFSHQCALQCPLLSAPARSPRQVVEKEDPKGDWGFKALKQMIKVNFRLVRAHPSQRMQTHAHSPTRPHPHTLQNFVRACVHTTRMQPAGRHMCTCLLSASTLIIPLLTHEASSRILSPRTHCADQGNYDAVMDTYRTLLTYIESAVAKNYSEKSINNLMDRISTAGVSALASLCALNGRGQCSSFTLRTAGCH